MVKKIFSIDDARALAKRRMPKMMFDFVDGAAGNEYACEQNQTMLDQIRLLPRVLVNVENRSLKKTLLGREWDLPFGIAPMGMCNLTWPDADNMLAAMAVKHNIPLAVSTMASSSIEDTYACADKNAWFQLYVGESDENAFDIVRRVEAAGYNTLILTVDLPIIAPRPREQRNGFHSAIKIGPWQFFDFAMHPQWSIPTLLAGIPELANFTGGYADKKAVRDQNRAKVDWQFLDRLRGLWSGKLIVKGVLSPLDAVRIRDCNVDAVYVSNHGGRQLDSAPTSIEALPAIRKAVGDDYPLIFDSGVRSGDAVIKALELGADFVMMGRPFLYGIGAAGPHGLQQVFDLLINQLDTTLAQLGRLSVDDIDQSVIFNQTPGL